MTTLKHKRILIVNTFGIGDVLFTTPLISNIKAQAPDTYIGYLGNKRTAPILRKNPKINKVFEYERDEYKSVYDRSKLAFLKKIKEAVAELKSEKFDCVLDLSLQASTNIFMMAAGIETRIGYNYKNRSPFLTKKFPLSGFEGRHVVEYYLDLLESLGVKTVHREMELTITDEDRAKAAQLLKQHGLSADEKLFALVPGGGASWGKDADYKRWDAKRYSKLADKIIEKFNGRIILMGDQKERDLCSKVAESMANQAVNAAGETSVTEFAALLTQCRLAVLNDGGPLHVAVASGVRTVSIFGPVDANVYGPFPADNHRVVTKPIACRPCYRKFRRASCDHISCLRDLEVDDVLSRVEELI